MCIVQTFGELGDGTAVTLHFETYDIDGYQAHGILIPRSSFVTTSIPLIDF